MAALLPVVVDATAAVATRIWLAADTATDAARRYARSVAIGAIAVSLVGNCIDHLASAGYLRPGVWLVIAVGGVAPVALAVVAHLAVLHALPGQQLAPVTGLTKAEAAPVPAMAPVAAPAATSATPATTQASPVAPKTRAAAQGTTRKQAAMPTRVADGRSWDDLVVAARTVDARTRRATGKPAGIATLKAGVGVGQDKAQRLRDYLAALPHPIEHANGYGLVEAAG